MGIESSDGVIVCSKCQGDRVQLGACGLEMCSACKGQGLVVAPAFAARFFPDGPPPAGDVDAVLEVTLGDELAAAGAS